MNYHEAWANGEIEAGTLVDAIESLTAELAELKAQPGRVVMPDSEHMQDMIDRLCDSASKEDAVFGWHECLEFVARLNSSPVSAGGPCAAVKKSLTAGSAGVVDERAAFEAWYLGHFYMGDKHCGLEWLSTEPCGGYRHQHPAEQWIVWQARAVLSAKP